VKQIRSKVGIKKFLKSEDNALPPRDLVFLLQDWDDGYNVGGMFRVADACGAAMLVMTGKTPVPEENPQIGVTSMGAHRRVRWKKFASHDEGVNFLREEGYSLIAVEVAEGATPYQRFEYPEKCALVLGSEGAGVYGKVMKLCDDAVFIPMAGKGRSLNVHVAASIVAFRVILGPSTSTEPE
jgi:23S rRNA (guanosine2251-2'-O)-methyltransferase